MVRSSTAPVEWERLIPLVLIGARSRLLERWSQVA
jgi:hypothetical protein